jgi:hypothetical protein
LADSNADKVIRILEENPDIWNIVDARLDRDSQVKRLVQKTRDDKELGRMVRRLYNKKETA